jgi:multiple sugar transport system substrate-binding protein
MQLSGSLLRAASVVVLAAALLSTGMTVSARAQDSNPKAAQGLGPIKGEIRFSWWGSQARNQKTDKILQLFEADNPGVRVLREQGDFAPHFDKLTVQAAGGNQPCTIQMQTRYLATFAKPNILLPLDDLFAKGAFNVAGIAQPILDSSKGNDGHLYMIPSGVFYFALLYNKSLLEQTGVRKLPDSYTWNQFAEWLREIKGKLPKGVNATHNMGRETDAFVTWVQSQGYKMFDGAKVGFPPSVAAAWFTYWEKLRKDGVTDSPEMSVEDNGSLVEESQIAQGRTFLTNRPPNRLDSHQKVLDKAKPGQKLSIMSYPTGENGTTGMDLGANGISIGATCPANLIPAAVAWINFFTEDQRAADIYQSDNGVVAIDRFQTVQMNSSDTSAGQKEHIELFQKVANTAKPVAWPAGAYAAVTDAIARAYDAVQYQQMTTEEAAKQFVTDLQDAVTKGAK